VPPSSHALIVRVRSMSASILSLTRPPPTLRPTSSSTAPERAAVSEFASVSAHSKATTDLANEFSRSSPEVFAETVPLSIACATFAGSLHLRVPTTLANSRLRGLPCDLAATPPTVRVCLPRLLTFRESASHVSCWNALGHPPFRGFSPSSPHGPLELCCPPCRSPPCGVAASRI